MLSKPKFFTTPNKVAAQLERMSGSIEAMTETMTRLIDQQAAALHANTARMDALALRLGDVEHHLEYLRGSLNGAVDSDTR